MPEGCRIASHGDAGKRGRKKREGGRGKGEEGRTANRRSGQGFGIIYPIIRIRVVSRHAVIQHVVAINVFAARVLE